MSQRKSTLLLEHYLKALKLPTILREYTKIAQISQQDQSSFEVFLLRLFEREIHDREIRARERRIKGAKFPVIKTLDSFNFTEQPGIDPVLIRELMVGEYIDQRENVLLIGNSGTGKTHLATALGFAACEQGRKVRFFSATGMVTMLLERRDEKALDRFHKQLDRLDLVILDELGYIPFSKAGAELLFEVISRAYERTSIILTSNLPFESWTEVFGSERLTGALLDRLTHRIHIIEANGESFRLRDSKRRAKKRDPKKKKGDKDSEK